MKALLVLCLYFIVLEAAVYRTVLQRTASLRERLIRLGKLKEVLKPGDSNLKVGSQHFIDYNDNFYLVNITIGTPLILMNFRASSTYKKHGRQFSISYGSGYCSGYLGTDVLSLAGLTYQTQTFGIATTIAPVFGYQPIDGIMGLGWPALADGTTPPMQNLLSQLDQPIFTVYMSRHITPPIQGGDGGLITYGGFDDQNCDRNSLNWVTLSSETYWQFVLTGFSIGNYSFNRWQQVISDTGTSFLYAPFSQFDHIANAVGAEFSLFYGLYQVNCTKLLGGTQPAPPPIVFTIGGIEYSVPHTQYIIQLQIGVNETQCFLAADGEGSAGFGPSWILGDVFIRSYCNVHDVKNIRIGFANLKNPF